MKRCLIALLMFSSPAMANTTGEDVAKWIESSHRIEAGTATAQDSFNGMEYLGYVNGVADMGFAGHHLCWRKGISGKQLLAVVSVYVEQHPQRWREPGWRLVLEALQEMYPCAEK
jgi:Ssp1 endopeptidase immunity protein Rap1a